jgi:hypothetical protein
MGLSVLRLVGVAVLFLLAGCGGAREEQDDEAGPATEVATTPEAGGDRGEASEFHFTPATFRRGERVVLPVTFTDGTSAKLGYPSKLDLAALGVGPYSSGRLHNRSATAGRSDVVGRDFWIFHGRIEDVLASLNGGTPPRLLAQYEGVDGQTVGFWDIQSDQDADYLGFQFARWAVLVYDYAATSASPGAAMTDAERASWAANFSGEETADGFLLLEGAGPLRLARAGEHAGPQLSFGTVEPARSFTLYPGECRPHRDQKRLVHGKLVDWSTGFADWCLSESMRAHATGSDSFIADLIRDLEVREVTLASP